MGEEWPSPPYFTHQLLDTYTAGSLSPLSFPFTPPPICAWQPDVWTPRESVRLWVGVATSSDGQKMVAAAYMDYIYTSSSSTAVRRRGEVKGGAEEAAGAPEDYVLVV